ncbi:MAG: anaerobic sulfatase-maturation protein [Bacteroidales bacterium]
MPRFDKNKTLTLGDAIKVTRPRAFMLMAKPIGPVCNLNCTYCYYLEKEKLYGQTSGFRMKEGILEEYIKQFIESHEVPLVTFSWQGGEPTLLGLDFFEKAVALQAKYRGNKRIDNALQTNGTRLDEAWCRFLNRNKFLVGISIDGPAAYHDRYRKFKSGKPSFDEVMRGIRLLRRFRVEFNTLTVINEANATHAVEVYRFLKKIGSRYLQFIPIVERQAEQPTPEGLTLVAPGFEDPAVITDWSVRSRQYGKFMIQIFDEWVKQDVGQVFVQLFDATLANWVGATPGLCVYAETCGEAAAIEHNGDVYSCDHFVYPENLLGNITRNSLVEMMGSATQIQFGKDKRDTLPDVCLRCEYRFACHGGCPKSRIALTPAGKPGLNWLCEGYKMFFAHVAPYMEFMANELLNERPPANVMRSELVGREKTKS